MFIGSRIGSYSTASYQQRNLQRIRLDSNDLTDWGFSQQNLTGAVFGSFIYGSSTLTNANLSDADLTGAYFVASTLTNANLTDANLTGPHFYQSGLTNANLARADLTSASFYYSTLTNANFAGANLYGADLRFAMGFQPADSTLLDNTILPDGAINGLQLADDEKLLIRDVEQSIRVRDAFQLDADSTFELKFYDADWGSKVGFDAGIVPHLDGTLLLSFDKYAYFQYPWGIPAEGVTIDLFDWPSPLEPDNRFRAVILELPPDTGTYLDLSRLYTTGEVTFLPEPDTIVLLVLGVVACVCRLIPRHNNKKPFPLNTGSGFIN